MPDTVGYWLATELLGVLPADDCCDISFVPLEVERGDADADANDGDEEVAEVRLVIVFTIKLATPARALDFGACCCVDGLSALDRWLVGVSKPT